MRFDPKQKFILNIRDKAKQKFIIPEYQRPYRWSTDECETLWNDMVSVFEEKKENEKAEYFLGSIVSFENSDGNLEIIDGQQRITTLTLLFRAFYASFTSKIINEQKQGFLYGFGGFIWEKDPATFKFNFEKTFLESNVITSRDKNILDKILKEDLDFEYLKQSNSNYAKNFLYFYDAIEDFKSKRSLDFESLCSTILTDTFFVLSVTCDSQESAMTIFNTLNSRGMPLSNADIIKGHIYKNINNKEEFAKKWQEISSEFEEYNPKEDMSVLFIQAMHAIRGLNNHTDSTTPSVLDFFTKQKKGNFGAKDKYLIEQSKIDKLMKFVENSIYFWRDPDKFLSKKAYRYLSVLKFYPNDMWKFFVAFLIWKNMDHFNKDEYVEQFNKDFDTYLIILLKAVTAKLLANKADTNEIKYLVFVMNAKINQGNEFNEYKQLPDSFLERFSSSDEKIKPNKKGVKYILYLYSHIYDEFETDISNQKLEIEHILPQKWQNMNFGDWNEENHRKYLENIGNKILLDKKLNIKCADNFFSLKQKEYKKDKNSTEVKDLGNRENAIWSITDIKEREEKIRTALKNFVTEGSSL